MHCIRFVCTLQTFRTHYCHLASARRKKELRPWSDRNAAVLVLVVTFLSSLASCHYLTASARQMNGLTCLTLMCAKWHAASLQNESSIHIGLCLSSALNQNMLEELQEGCFGWHGSTELLLPTGRHDAPFFFFFYLCTRPMYTKVRSTTWISWKVQIIWCAPLSEEKQAEHREHDKEEPYLVQGPLHLHVLPSQPGAHVVRARVVRARRRRRRRLPARHPREHRQGHPSEHPSGRRRRRVEHAHAAHGSRWWRVDHVEQPRRRRRRRASGGGVVIGVPR